MKKDWKACSSFQTKSSAEVTKQEFWKEEITNLKNDEIRELKKYRNVLINPRNL
jgi:hypothetical protein